MRIYITIMLGGIYQSSYLHSIRQVHRYIPISFAITMWKLHDVSVYNNCAFE